jgi:hypothetical protein
MGSHKPGQASTDDSNFHGTLPVLLLGLNEKGSGKCLCSNATNYRSVL